MKIIGIVGSARKGNGLALTEAALAGAKDSGAEVELIRLSETTIKPCLDCAFCKKPGNKYCIQKDGMQDIYRKIEGADGIILSTPVYFYRASALYLSFIDRLYAMVNGDFSSKFSPKKKFATIVTIGSMGADVAEKIHASNAQVFGEMFGWKDCGLLWKNMMHDRSSVETQPQLVAEAKAFGKKLL